MTNGCASKVLLAPPLDLLTRNCFADLGPRMVVGGFKGVAKA
jgi:hypothetical protein